MNDEQATGLYPVTIHPRGNITVVWEFEAIPGDSRESATVGAVPLVSWALALAPLVLLAWVGSRDFRQRLRAEAPAG